MEISSQTDQGRVSPRGKFRFFYSDAYLLLLTALIFIAWYFSAEQIAIVAAIMLGCIVLCAQRDTLPILPILFVAPMAFPHNVDPITYWPMFFMLIPVAFSIVFHFVRYRPEKWKPGKMFWPQLLVSAALLAGGALAMTPDQWKVGLTYALMLGALILLLYTALGSTLDPAPDVDIKRYVMSALMYMGLLLVAEIAVFFVRTEQPMLFWATANLDLGWGISNNAATMLLLSAPACFYLALHTRALSPLYILIGAVQFVGIFFTFSRGGILAGAVVLLPTVIYAGCKAKSKPVYWVGVGVVALALALVLVFTRDTWLSLLRQTFSNGLDGSGRDKLYHEAWDGFLANPIFGLGIGHRGPNYTVPNVPMYWFHSTAFQIIGSMGAVGLAAYLVYYVARFRVVLRARPFNIMLFLSMLGFEGYSMIDTGTFVPIPCMLVVILLTLACEKVNEREPKVPKTPKERKRKKGKKGAPASAPESAAPTAPGEEPLPSPYG